MQEQLSERVQTRGHMNKGGAKSNFCLARQEFNETVFYQFGVRITVNNHIGNKYLI